MSTLSGKREASVNRQAASVHGHDTSVNGHGTSATNNVEEVSVVIVGAGQRGLSTLERLCSFYPTYTNAPRLRVHVVDPGHPGQDSGPARTGPSYGEWLSQSGYRWKDGGIVRNDNGDPIHPDTYTSRALLGCYLRWSFEHIRAEAPEGVIIKNHGSEAIDIQRRGEGNGFVISLEGERPIEADYVFVTTGHASGSTSKANERTLANFQALRSRNPHLGFIPSAAAFGDLEAIESTAKVLIYGTGLSAADALSVLTAGRGGRFEANGDRRLRYVISGREPNITLYSRQGLPSGAKGVNQRALGEDYEPKYFTSGFIAAKRRERDGGQLNWKEDIHPCLIREV
ncbi:unnamed protein product [Clonostachys solani]|uniref:FAD-dependent urate hydroxylase HpyO/Asp monooxygenase CreE-like FAD/NAD(P)-binding domain-containing protein n=1 Tax=Clonostachys solani TaxID=160281 RepID=A0A9N9Z1P5_9HYPO|nr:unnamed protein product [Clonostachys solani]